MSDFSPILVLQIKICIKLERRGKGSKKYLIKYSFRRNISREGAFSPFCVSGNRKSSETSVHIVRLSKREIVGSLAYLPFLLSRIGLTISVPVFSISDAVHCNRPRSALQPSLQCTASVLAVHYLLVILLLLMVNVGLHGHTIITIEG